MTTQQEWIVKHWKECAELAVKARQRNDIKQLRYWLGKRNGFLECACMLFGWEFCAKHLETEDAGETLEESIEDGLYTVGVDPAQPGSDRTA